MGKKIVLTGTTLTDASAPTLATVDPIESAGSLLLIEPNHPSQQWAAGVPANSASLPNLLPTALGAADTATFLTNGALTSTKGLLERSTKGGLHGIVSKAVALTSGDGARIRTSDALATYMLANKAHDFYFSAWDRLTRVAATGGEPYDYATHYSTGAGLFASQPASWTLPPGETNLGSRTLGNVAGGRFGNLAVDQAILTSTGQFKDGAGLPTWGAPSNSLNAISLASRNSKWTSFVFYRVYLEDLTVSGRTYAEVDALDYALYTAQVTTSGGRYYGDTYTDPATIA